MAYIVEIHILAALNVKILACNVTMNGQTVFWGLKASPIVDWVNPTEVVVRQLGAQPAHKAADINSSAAALT